MTLRTFWIRGALGLAMAASAAMVAAQDEGLVPSTAGLDLPKDLTIFGNADPTLHKATAIVNGTIITDTDVDQRLNLVLAANGGTATAEEKERLRLQVLRNLIDETLQIQEAKAQDIKIDPNEIDETYGRVARNFKQGADQFAAYLKNIGSSERSMKRQIEGELSWRRVLGRKVEPFVNVGEEEVNAVMARLNAAKGTEEFHIGEIFLSATPETTDQVRANAERISDQIRKGGSFVAYARQYSEASTAAVGGDLGWVRPEVLPDALAEAARQMDTGQLSAPIAVAGGFSMIVVLDKRQVLTSDPRDALLSLKQISVSFPAGTTQAQASPKVAQFAEMLKGISGCGKADDAGKAFGADVVANDQVKIRDLPPALQEMMLKLSVGQATPPFGSLADGVRSLVLCGRDDPAAVNGPSYDQIYAQMEEERVNRRAQRYLRDLRRDAVVDYR